jgi:hypothetical protein
MHWLGVLDTTQRSNDMAIIQVQGTYHNMPVIFHQEDGKTVKITPGSFCPRCQDRRYRIIDEGFIECHQCGRCYFVPSQAQIDALQARVPSATAEQTTFL